MAKGDKKVNRAAEVLTVETTINLNKRLHGMYVLVAGVLFLPSGPGIGSPHLGLRLFFPPVLVQLLQEARPTRDRRDQEVC